MTETLIVEDSEQIRRRIILTIKRKNIALDYSEAGTFSEAKKFISKNSFSLFILDIGLPDGNGLDLIPDIRKKYGNKCKIIIFSSYSSPGMRKSAIEKGADYFFDKSAEFNDLFALLKSV